MGDLSLINYPDRETSRVVSTPLSLEACRMEGVLPSELLYRPLDSFAKPDLPTDVQQLHYEFYESRRLENLQTLRSIREKLQRKRGVSEERSISYIVAKSEQFEQSMHATQAKQIALVSKAAVREAIHAKKLSQLKSDEAAKERAERERRKVEIARIRKETEEKRKFEIEKQKKEKEDEERRDRMRNQQQERDNDFMRREQEREEKLLQQRFALRENREKAREVILARLSERQQQQEHMKEEREEVARRRELLREQKLEQQKQTFKQKLQEKAKLRAMRRLKARQHADSFRKRVTATQRAADFLLSEEKAEERSEEYHRKLQHKLELLRKVSSERGLRIRQVQATAAAHSQTTRQKIMESMSRSQQRAEFHRKRLNEETQKRRHLSELKQLKKDYYIERQRRRDEYRKEQSARKLGEISERLEAFEAVKEKMVRERLQLTAESEQLKVSIKEAMHRMRVTKRWNEEEIMRLVGKNAEDDSRKE